MQAGSLADLDRLVERGGGAVEVALVAQRDRQPEQRLERDLGPAHLLGQLVRAVEQHGGLSDPSLAPAQQAAQRVRQAQLAHEPLALGERRRSPRWTPPRAPSRRSRPPAGPARRAAPPARAACPPARRAPAPPRRRRARPARRPRRSRGAGRARTARGSSRRRPSRAPAPRRARGSGAPSAVSPMRPNTRPKIPWARLAARVSPSRSASRSAFSDA